MGGASANGQKHRLRREKFAQSMTVNDFMFQTCPSFGE